MESNILSSLKSKTATLTIPVTTSTDIMSWSTMPALGKTTSIQLQAMYSNTPSRSDAFFGNNHVFNETIFNETRAYWTKPILNADMLANGKIARQIESKAYNPTYTFTSMMEEFSLGEVAAPVIAFGDIQAGTVNRSLVEYFFGEGPWPDM